MNIIAPTAQSTGKQSPVVHGQPTPVYLRREMAGSVGLALMLLIAWQWGPRVLGISSDVLPTLSDCWTQFLRMVSYEQLIYHSAYTAFAALVGFVLGSILGLLIGCVLGVSPTAAAMFTPYIVGLQIAPKVTFAPLFVIWFGYTIYPKILISVLLVFFPIVINVSTALHSVDRDIINLTRSFSATRLQIFYKVEFYSVLPELFAGLRISSTLAVIGAVVAEFMGGSEGVGYVIAYSAGSSEMAAIFVGVISLTIIGTVFYLAVVWLERRVLHYQPMRSAPD